MLGSGKFCCENNISKCPTMKKINSERVKIAMSTPEYKIKRKKIVQQICMTDEYKSKMSKKIKKLYEDNPELKDKISKKVREANDRDPSINERRSNSMKNNKRNVGDLNGMKKIEAREKVSKTLKKFYEDNPEMKLKIGQTVSNAWKNGKFDGVKTGRSKWYKYKHSSGKEYKVQGTWELAFIKWLDEHNMEFECHKGRIPYYFNGINRNYYPDFWIKTWNCYVDVKCEQFYNKEKFDAIINDNQDIKILVLFDESLKRMGVNLNERTKDFKHLEC